MSENFGDPFLQRMQRERRTTNTEVVKHVESKEVLAEDWIRRLERVEKALEEIQNAPVPLQPASPANDQVPVPAGIAKTIELALTRIEALEDNATANRELGRKLETVLDVFSEDLGQAEGRIRTIEVKWDALKRLAGLEA